MPVTVKRYGLEVSQRQDVDMLWQYICREECGGNSDGLTEVPRWAPLHWDAIFVEAARAIPVGHLRSP